MAKQEETQAFDDPIEELASMWDNDCSSVTLQMWNPATTKFAMVDKYPSPPSFQQVKAHGPGSYRLTIYRLGAKGVKGHVAFEIAGRSNQETPKPAPAPAPAPQGSSLTPELIADIAAKAALAAVGPLAQELKYLRNAHDPTAAITGAFKIVEGITTAVNSFGDKIAAQQERQAKIAESRARRAIAREEELYGRDEDGDGEDESPEDQIGGLADKAMGMLGQRAMKLVTGQSGGNADPSKVEDEWGVTA